MIKLDTLYKRTSTGAIQIWYMEVDGNQYRTTSGQETGKHVVSAWTTAEGKNVGRANETSPEDQALLEAQAIYKKKQEQGSYFPNKGDVDEETFFEPMLAKPFDADRLTAGERFYVQPKHNGVRCIVRMVPPFAYPTLWSRKGKQFVNCPHIGEELKPFFAKYPDAMLDGELYNHEYKAAFEKLISSIKKQKPTPATMALSASVVEFHVYDIPSLGHLPFGERWEELSFEFDLTIPENKIIRKSPTMSATDEGTIHGLHKRYLALGYEGTMVRLDAPYETKRTYSLMKYKDFKDEEFEIVNIQVGKGNWSDAAKIVTLKMADGREFGAGVKGNKEYAKKLLADRYEVIGKLGTVVFFDYTADKVPLFPIFHGVRDYE